jgi:hypothetical protein
MDLNNGCGILERGDRVKTGQKPTMVASRAPIWFWTGAVLVFQLFAVSGRGAEPVDFNRQIRPILSQSCYQCHGPDANKRKSDLRLDRREGLFRSQDDTTIIVPGAPDQSELLFRITSDDPELHMPPPKSGGRLTSSQVDLIRRWIAEGARWTGHWAYLPRERPVVPAGRAVAAAATEIDRFILARLPEQGLKPSPEAGRATLIRRLSFDLTGLPPTTEELEAFENDTGPDAYERLVDRLLASPHFGERMAIFWFDLVRYADTTGYHSDNHVDMYLFRDYVIQSFNENKPFDRFTIEQLAGDLLTGATDLDRIASGYNRLLLTTQEGGGQPKEYMAKYSADRVRNVSSVWLGATLGCAECHDHKFDPFTTREFYSLAAFFADIQETAVGVQEPTFFPATPEQVAALKRIEDERAPLKAVEKPTREQRRRLEELTELRRQIPNSLISTAIPPRIIRVLPRGDWLNESGPVASPDVPAAFPPLGVAGRRPTRLDLARWLVAASNPLVARVMVNRLWKLAFGQGLVETLDDFGSQGSSPTHPELLEWLGAEFQGGGWNIKAMLKMMVLSRTYRQSSMVDESTRLRDPANRWLARQSRFRLDAEFVRDNALAVAGVLSDRIGGPSVKPYQPPGYWVFLNFPVRDYVPDKGENQYRRGLYTYWQRTFLHPSLLAFDASTREECVVQRPRSNTPLQALVLLNDPTYVEAARVFAARMIHEAGSDPRARLERGFRLALSRPPQPRELSVLLALLAKHLDQYKGDPTAARALLGEGDEPSPPELDRAELAAWTSIARVLLNLQESVTRS